MRKGGVAKMVRNEIVSSSVMLVAATLCAGLVVPTATLPKSSRSGLTSSWFSSNAKAELGKAKAMVRSRVKTANVKRDKFVRRMAFLPRNRALRN